MITLFDASALSLVSASFSSVLCSGDSVRYSFRRCVIALTKSQKPRNFLQWRGKLKGVHMLQYVKLHSLKAWWTFMLNMWLYNAKWGEISRSQWRLSSHLLNRQCREWQRVSVSVFLISLCQIKLISISEKRSLSIQRDLVEQHMGSVGEQAAVISKIPNASQGGESRFQHREHFNI